MEKPLTDAQREQAYELMHNPVFLHRVVRTLQEKRQVADINLHETDAAKTVLIATYQARWNLCQEILTELQALAREAGVPTKEIV